MNKVMAMTALAAGLLVSTAAISAPANLSDAFATEGGLTLVRGGGGGGGGGAGGYVGGMGGGGRMGAGLSGGAGAHFSSNNHIGAMGRPSGGPRTHLGANDRFDNGRGHDHDHGHRGRFPGDVFVFGGYGDYDYGYTGDCNWLRHQAAVTGSRYWWRRYQQCLY